MSAISQGRKILLTTGILLLVGACSGGATGAPPTSPPSSAQAPASTPAGSLPAVDAPAASEPATDAPASSGDAQAGTGGGADACTIVTHDDVAKATGFAVATTSGAGAICYYQNADPSQYLVVQLFASKADMASMTEIEPGSEHIDGLGDDAFWAAVGGILFVRKGDHGAEFVDTGFSFGTGDTTARDAMVTLARTALPKL